MNGFRYISALKLPLRAWKTVGNVFPSVILATFIINLLSLAFPIALLQIYDRVIPNNSLDTLLLLILAVSTALLVETLLRFARSYICCWADAKFEHITTCEIFKRTLEAPFSDIEKEGEGVHLERISAVSHLRDFYVGQIITALLDIPFVLLFLVLIYFIAGGLVMIPLLMLGAFFIVSGLYSVSLHSAREEKRKNSDHRTNFLLEIFGGIHTVKGEGMEALMLRRYERLQAALSRTNSLINSKSALASNYGMIISQITIVLMVAFGSYDVINDQLTVGAVAACTLLAIRCSQPVTRAMGLWSRLQLLQIAELRINEALNLPKEAGLDQPDLPPIVGKIEIKDLGFDLPNYMEPIFNNLNLTVTPGEMIAITGESACGKSTLLMIMMSLLRPSRGQVLIDGHDLAEFNPESIRQQIAYLSEDSNLFQGTIMDNLTLFSKESADIHLAKQLADMFELGSIIEKLPFGYDTLVGNQVVETLSPGIKQRIAIVRALCRKPKILLFDEANTSIDQQGDALLLKMLKRLKGCCTIVMVTHRPSILAIADHIYDGTKQEIRLHAKN